MRERGKQNAASAAFQRRNCGRLEHFSTWPPARPERRCHDVWPASPPPASDGGGEKKKKKVEIRFTNVAAAAAAPVLLFYFVLLLFILMKDEIDLTSYYILHSRSLPLSCLSVFAREGRKNLSYRC